MDLMNTSTQEHEIGVQTESTDLKEIAADVVRRAMQGGATAAEAVAMDGSEFSTVVRLGEVETLKESGSKAIGVRVFFGQRAASTYSSDLTAGRRAADGGLGAGAGQDHQRRPIRRNSRAGATRQTRRRPRPLSTTTSTRSPLPTASTMRAARRKRRSTPTRASSTPRAAPSTRPSATRCWPTRTDSSATPGDRIARFRRCPSRRWKVRRCSATTGTRSR